MNNKTKHYADDVNNRFQYKYDGAITFNFLNDPLSHLGTPILVTDESGNVVWKGEYDPFGKCNVVTSSIDNPIRFPGQYADAETGLYYNWHRYYDAGTGRYTREDPVGGKAGINYYNYAKNNSIIHKDTNGLFIVTAVLRIDLIMDKCKIKPCVLQAKMKAKEIGLSNNDYQEKNRQNNYKFYHCIAGCLVAQYCYKGGIQGYQAGVAAQSAYEVGTAIWPQSDSGWGGWGNSRLEKTLWAIDTMGDCRAGYNGAEIGGLKSGPQANPENYCTEKCKNWLDANLFGGF